MKLTEIGIRRKDMKRLRAIVSLGFDNGQLRINDVKLIQTKRELCVEFPRDAYEKREHLESIVPNKALRQEIEAQIQYHYQSMKESEILWRTEKLSGLSDDV